MAIRSVAVQPRLVSERCAKFTWTGLLNGDSGEPIDWTIFADRSVQVLGTLGAGGTVLLEGSNDGGTTWATLNDAGGSPLSMTSLKIEQVLEMTEKVRPRVSAGDGTTNLTVIIVARKA